MLKLSQRLGVNFTVLTIVVGTVEPLFQGNDSCVYCGLPMLDSHNVIEPLSEIGVCGQFLRSYMA